MKIITKTNLFQEPNIFPANAQNRKFSENDEVNPWKKQKCILQKKLRRRL